MKKIILASGFIGILLGLPNLSFAGVYVPAQYQYGCGSQIVQSLQTGSENNDVYTLQQMLYANGYLQANPNGYFGPATRQAVKDFQRAHGLYTTGTVGEATLDAVNAQLCSTSYATYNTNDSYNYSDYSTGVTYVDTYDPYVKNITTEVTYSPYTYTSPTTNYNTYNPATTAVIQPATTNASFVYGTNIVYSPNIGYTYGLIPQSGSLTITSPGVDSHYNEGDTVSLSWTTNNITNVSKYQVVLENTSTGQSRVVTTTSGNTATFVLTKEILDQVCTGSCSQSYVQGAYRLVITTPLTDISGATSIFRAAVSPITIKRPYLFYGTVTISGSKNPVNSGELFKLYVNVPTNTYNNYYDASVYGQYSLRIHALCPLINVQVMVAGTPCGQEFSIPFTLTNSQQEIPAMITNNTYYKHDVVFVADIISPLGQIVGTAQTTITGNAMPIAW